MYTVGSIANRPQHLILGGQDDLDITRGRNSASISRSAPSYSSSDNSNFRAQGEDSKIIPAGIKKIFQSLKRGKKMNNLSHVAL